MTYHFKEYFSDKQNRDNWDIMNIVCNKMPTLRKQLDRDSVIEAQAQSEGIIKDNLIKIFKDIPEEDMTEDFYRGYSVAETVWNTAIHNYFLQEHGIEHTDLDVIFKVDENNRPVLDIELPEDFNGGSDEDEEPTPDAPNPLDDVKLKLKED